MKLHLAALFLVIFLKYLEFFPERKINILRSFGVPNNEDDDFFITYRDKCDKILYDCGTYTLNNPEATQEAKDRITLEGYKEKALYVNELCDDIFSFDSDWSKDGFETNIYNQTYLEEAGLSPVLVIHNIFSDEVNYIIDSGCKMVAIGSQEINHVDTLAPIVYKLRKAGVRVHLFGTTRYDLVAPLPIYSCDSSSWAKTGAFGNVNYWNPLKDNWNKTDTIYMEEYYHSTDKKVNYFSEYEYREEFEEYLYNTFRLTHEDLLGKYRHYNIHLINTHYYMELERIINDEHRRRGILVE